MSRNRKDRGFLDVKLLRKDVNLSFEFLTLSVRSYEKNVLNFMVFQAGRLEFLPETHRR
jgi:hypothetical protein